MTSQQQQPEQVLDSAQRGNAVATPQSRNQQLSPIAYLLAFIGSTILAALLLTAPVYAGTDAELTTVDSATINAAPVDSTAAALAPALPTPSMHAQQVRVLLEQRLGDQTPNWLGLSNRAEYIDLIVESFSMQAKTQALKALLETSTQNHARLLLVEYLKYSVLANSGLWCSEPLQRHTTINANVNSHKQLTLHQQRVARYLLWLHGDLGASNSLMSDGFKLCTINQQTVAHNTISDRSIIPPSALRRFQKRNGLIVTGRINRATLDALTEQPEQIATRLRLNIERMNSVALPQEGRYIVANIPAFELNLIEDQESILKMRTIVGKTDRQTPELALNITHVVVNPSWSVPTKIAKRDIVPKIVKDPAYLENRNMSVYANWSPGAERLNSGDVDWKAARKAKFPYAIRQQPGPGNALGQFKFASPNAQAIYLHDTNSKKLFNKTKRAFSSGCVRLEQPKALALALLQGSRYGKPRRLDKQLGKGKTSYLRLRESVSTHLVYWTAWVDANGKLQQRRDLYGKDKSLPTLLLTGR